MSFLTGLFTATKAKALGVYDFRILHLVCWLSVSLFYSLIAKCAEAYMDGFIFEELFWKHASMKVPLNLRKFPPNVF